MGSTRWTYTVPYQHDMSKVLQDLRQEVFERGDFERPIAEFEFLEEIEFFEADPQEQQQMLAENDLTCLQPLIDEFGVGGLHSLIETLCTKTGLVTNEEFEALQCLNPDGTGTILDIYHVQDKNEIGVLAPVSQDFLRTHFGTDQPTQELFSLWQNRPNRVSERFPYDRGEGIYFILYKDGIPDAIYIEGCSGD